jgi:hypothetical protein
MNETLLFWIILSGFLLLDNFVVLSHGKDVLSISRKGKAIFVFRQRGTYFGKDVIFLNPINLFDRVIICPELTLYDDKVLYKRELRWLESTVKKLNGFVYLGYIYFLYLLVNCYLSFQFGFQAVAINLILGHVAIWLCSIALAIWVFRYEKIPLPVLFATFAEVLFVPAYLLNVNKKLLRIKELKFSSLRFKVRNIKRMSVDEADLARYHLLSQTTSALEVENDQGKTELLKGFLKCLKI